MLRFLRAGAGISRIRFAAIGHAPLSRYSFVSRSLSQSVASSRLTADNEAVIVAQRYHNDCLIVLTVIRPRYDQDLATLVVVIVTYYNLRIILVLGWGIICFGFAADFKKRKVLNTNVFLFVCMLVM